MTVQDIFNEWLNKNVDFDRAYGSQCVDWVRQFCQESGHPIGTFGGSAIVGWNTGCPFGSTWRRVEYLA